MNLIDFLSDHTYRTVLGGTVVIGFTAGTLGTLAYLRKQTLLADVVSHSAIGGTMVAFLAAASFGLDGRASWVLILGSAVISLIAVSIVSTVSRSSVTGIDSAMAIVLALFFGGGMVLHRVILNGPYPNKGGLQDYLFGNASHLTTGDVWSLIVISLITFTIAGLFRKELVLVCFDAEHARTLGFSPNVLDRVVNLVIVLSVVIGIKAVGLILMVAFAIAPPIAARQWTQKVGSMALLSGLFGASGAAIGAWVATSLGRYPTGPVIVVVLTAFAVISLLISPRRSLLLAAWARHRHRAELAGAAS